MNAFSNWFKNCVKNKIFWKLGWLLYRRGLFIRLCGVALGKAGMERVRVSEKEAVLVKEQYWEVNNMGGVSKR